MSSLVELPAKSSPSSSTCGATPSIWGRASNRRAARSASSLSWEARTIVTPTSPALEASARTTGWTRWVSSPSSAPASAASMDSVGACPSGSALAVALPSSRPVARIRGRTQRWRKR